MRVSKTTAEEMKPQAMELYRRFYSHFRGDHCAAVNTLMSIFGKAVMRHLPLNPPYSFWLEEIAGGYIEVTGSIIAEKHPTAAATAMVRHRLERGRPFLCGVRRLPMTPEAQAALLGYYREELALLREIGQFAMKAKHWHYRRSNASSIARHIAAVEQVIGLVAHEPTQPLRSFGEYIAMAKIPQRFAGNEFVAMVKAVSWPNVKTWDDVNRHLVEQGWSQNFILPVRMLWYRYCEQVGIPFDAWRQETKAEQAIEPTHVSLWQYGRYNS